MQNIDNFELGVQSDAVQQAGFESAADLLKAMEAGLGTGRDYTDQLHNGPGLKVESLDPVVKVLTNKLQHLRTWQMIPKNKIFNTVHEYNQLNKYGDEVGIFNLEGETPQFTDSQYRRKAATTKFMGVGGQVSDAAMMVKRADGRDALAVEVENKTVLLLTEINRLLVSADDSKVDTQFQGFWRNHLEGINDIYGGITGLTAEQALDNYYGDTAVIDARGAVLTDALVEDAANASVNDRFGMISDILSNPIVFNDYVKNFHESKRVMVNNPMSATDGATMGQSVNDIVTQFGKVNVNNDIYFDKRTPKAYNTAATNDKAPVIPVVGGTPIAVITDAKTNFDDSDGNYFYAVTAKNRYGESPMLVLNTSAQAVAVTESVDLQFTAGVGGYAAESYVIYRTDVNVTPYTTAKYYPLFEVSLAELASGYDGAAATKVRDRNRVLANTHSAIVFYNSPEYWEYLQLAPTRRMDFAITSPSRRFSVLNYGTPVWYQPGKITRIINIGRP
jgi:hypothetical protein